MLMSTTEPLLPVPSVKARHPVTVDQDECSSRTEIAHGQDLAAAAADVHLCAQAAGAELRQIAESLHRPRRVPVA